MNISRPLSITLLTVGLVGCLMGGIQCASHAHIPPPEETPAAVKPSPPLRHPRQLLADSWSAYIRHFIQEDGRVIDHKGGGHSTSEGQTYAMLRAVWMQDVGTFEKVYRWSTTNLRGPHRQDKLLAWKWGRKDDQTWTILDKNSASDADVLLAYTLLLAAERFKTPSYHTQALEVLADVWALDTAEVGGARYLLAGDWRPDAGPLPLNPSYLMPFALSAFQQADPAHDWNAVRESSYRVLETCRSKVGLPTDWCWLEADGRLWIQNDPTQKFSDFGFEAFRVYWNLTASFRWDKDSRAQALLTRMGWLNDWWRIRRELPAIITVSGIPRETWRSLGMYGAFYPALALEDSTQANLLYRQGIEPTYKDGRWGEPNDYYVQNWIWFGLALQSELPRP